MAAPVPTTIDGLPTLTINSLNTYSGTFDSVNDLFVVYDNSSNSTVNIDRNNALGIVSTPVGISDSQTLTNKTITSPTISNPTFSGTLTGTYTIGGTPTFPSSVTQNTASQTLTNKTLTSPTINSPTISNATITADSYAGFTVSNTGTIYGISVTTGQISSALTMTSTLAVTGAVSLSSTLSSTGQPSFQTATAMPAAGASTAGIKLSSTANFGIFFGSGAPTFSAAQGSYYLRSDGSSTSTRAYINTNGTTGWTNVTTAA